MASSSANQESRTQKQAGPWSPLSPQFRYSLSRKSPRFSQSPKTVSSKTVFPRSSLSSQTEASIANGSYEKVTSQWSPDNTLWSSGFYLSRTSLLKEMYSRRKFCRRSVCKRYNGATVAVHRSLEDCWEIYPIHLPIRLEKKDLPTSDYLGNEEPTSIVYANAPMKSTRYSAVQFDNERPFLWVTNTTGTKFLDRWRFISRDILHVNGHAECPICNEIFFIEYRVPEVLDMLVTKVAGEEVNELQGETLQFRLQPIFLGCVCTGNLIQLRPIISDIPNKINWVLLLMRFEVGLCTIDQLKYYCIQRRLSICDDKNKMVVTVFNDIWEQIFLRRFGEEDQTVHVADKAPQTYGILL